MIRRLLLVLLGAAAAVLVPWTAHLARTLPDRFDTGQWRVAWVGFDTALLLCFAAAAWLGHRRRRAALPLLAATAAMLCCDAWFDVVLGWASPDRWGGIGLALGAELPIAALLLLRARSLLAGGMRRRTFTTADVELRQDPDCAGAIRALQAEPSTVDGLARTLGRPTAAVRAALRRLGGAGYVRRGPRGRWRTVPMDLREPAPEAFDPAVARYYDAKYDTELRLFTWAARHRGEFGSWATGHRSQLHLTEAELAAFDAEYSELLTRYCLLRRRPAPETRDIMIRHYAFPCPQAQARPVAPVQCGNALPACQSAQLSSQSP